MGVTRDSRDLFHYGYIEDELEQLEDDVQTDSIPNGAQQKKRKNCKSRVRMRCSNDSINFIGRRKLNTKQTRRKENMQYLLSLVEKDECLEPDFNICEPHTSAFTELFSEQKNMKAWHEFISSSEEDQQALLQGKARKRADDLTTDGKSDLEESWEEIPDRRTAHPAFTPNECYGRIDKNIKSYLKRRHVPLGLLASIEEDLTSFFHEWPSSIYVCKLTTSFERMMLHSLCQYLDLKSQSFSENGERQTQVENRHPNFNPPRIHLSSYLQQHDS